VLEKYLAVAVESLGSLVVDVRSEERNMWEYLSWGGRSGRLYASREVNFLDPPLWSTSKLPEAQCPTMKHEHQLETTL
jgi:hypothetical protein